MANEITTTIPSASENQPPSSNQELIKEVKQLILLSIGLKFEEKGALIMKLQSFSEEKLNRLKQVFEEENQRKQELLGKFFQEHPELFADFERFSKQHVDSIYEEVEQSELGTEEERMKQLLATTF